MAAIPKDAQFYSSFTKSYFKIEGVNVCIWEETKWVSSLITPQQLKEYVTSGAFGFQEVTADSSPFPEPMEVKESVWVLQYLDNPKDFGGLDPVTGEHPIRVNAFQAYAFKNEQEAILYAQDKKNLLVPALLVRQAKVEVS